MKHIRFFFFLLFFFCCGNLYSQEEIVGNYIIEHDKQSSDVYIIRKDRICEDSLRSSFWIAIQSRNRDLLAPFFSELSVLVRRELFEKCDTNVNFRVFAVYNLEHSLCDISYFVPSEYFHCFSVSFFDDFQSLLRAMSPGLPLGKIIDKPRAGFQSNIPSRRPSGYTRLYMRIDKALLDRYDLSRPGRSY